MIIDLHTHSTASDGTDSPAALVRHAAAVGVDVLAITDHDTTAGWAAATEALPDGLTLVPGAEFSCAYFFGDGRRIGIHLLGYLFDPLDAGLAAEQKRLRDSRVVRARQIVENLAADGIPVSWEQVSAIAGGDATVGRPHLGRALVDAGVVATVTDAFAELLHSDSKYYVRKADTDVLAAIRLVAAAGGVTVFAHPLARHRGRVIGDDVIAELAATGLAGIEVDHPDHTPQDREHLTGLAAELGLITTGSSDYHGTNKTTQIAACRTSPEAYEAILSRPTARRPVSGRR